jgi:cytochrome P450
MSTTQTSSSYDARQGAPYWDPYDPELVAEPYPAFKRLREEAPLYYNEKYGSYAALHTIHRGLLTRVFTPKRMNDLEPQIRQYWKLTGTRA